MSKFKYFDHYAADSYYNMAFDEWMLTDVLGGNSLFSLRLYSWSQGTVTFGANQNQDTALNFDRVGQTPVIRRVTGGRALYHDPSEITYSVAISDKYLSQVEWGRSVSQSSKELSKILVIFLSDIGIDSQFMRQSAFGNSHPEVFHKAPCFDSYSRYEILSGAEKIIASAQRRVRGGLLQHGAIKINGSKDHPAVPLKTDNPSTDNTLKNIEPDEFVRLSNLFKKSFERYLASKFTTGELSEDEKNQILHRENIVLKNCLIKRDLIKQK